MGQRMQHLAESRAAMPISDTTQRKWFSRREALAEIMKRIEYYADEHTDDAEREQSQYDGWSALHALGVSPEEMHQAYDDQTEFDQDDNIEMIHNVLPFIRPHV
jgi:hypothetical protein